MDPGIDVEWLSSKSDSFDEAQTVGNVARSWQWRERGINPPHGPSNKTVLENIAEDILVQKPLTIRSCDLPGYPRSTFLMVFSPDGTKVASTHGNHDIYVSELASGRHVRILKGHPRTPWCIAFHPSHTQLIGSGCLGGQVRVWDICSGGSEVWNVQKESVIASVAFHPREQLLVIATYNELYFWDWSQPAPFTKVSTNNINEKVRYVAFDSLGYKLITGISLSTNSGSTSSILQQNPMLSALNSQPLRRDDTDDSPGPSRPAEGSGTAQDMIVNSYQNLVQRYDSLVRNYQRLFMVRHRLTNTPTPPSTTDRGTDPMETDTSPNSSGVTRTARAPAPAAAPAPATATASTSATASASAPAHAPLDALPGPSGRGRADDSGGEGSSSRLPNLDVLSFDTHLSRSPLQDHFIFGSRSSAFQPLAEGRSFRTVDQNERSSRLLPNPFSASGSRATRGNVSDLHQADRSTHTSRTSIFTSSRSESALGRLLEHRRNSSPGRNTTASGTSAPAPGTEASPGARRGPPPGPSASTSTDTRRPTMTNSSTQMSPIGGSVDAQTINESLDLIRDILRDSGTRLLNLITNMSLSTLASVERGVPRRRSRAHSADAGEGAGGGGSGGGPGGAPHHPPHAPLRPRVRLLSRAARRHDLLSSTSDSDSDQSLEVNIFRTRNSTFSDEPSAEPAPDAGPPRPTERTVFELDEAQTEGNPGESGRINVTLVNDRFRVRTQNESAGTDEAPGEGARRAEGAEREADEPTPSTSAGPPRPPAAGDGFWSEGSAMTSQEAYRKVRSGVNALHKHTDLLTNLWLRGHRVTMRELRNLWENLRRRIITLQRDSMRHDGSMSSYYTRSLLERCMMLSDRTDSARAAARAAMRSARAAAHTAHGAGQNAPERDSSVSENTSNSNPTESDLNTSTESADNRSPSGHSPRSTASVRSSPSMRRRLQARWRPDEEPRPRPRNVPANRLSPRTNRSRRDFTRAIQISATRHEIRMRAMQVLSVMFNMMMMCLEERGLSQLIISMLRTLKKALALTCLMLMMNRNPSRQGDAPATPSPRVDPQIVVRIQNVDDAGPVNVDEPDEPAAPRQIRIVSRVSPEGDATKTNANNSTSTDEPSTSRLPPAETMEEQPPVPSTSSSNPQRWSNRLAVQIAEANRNYSSTARTRRELYLESKRQKALHRTNPAAHPIVKKRVLPPVTIHRIPALRVLPSKLRLSTPRGGTRNDGAIAGPSNAGRVHTYGYEQESRDEMLNEFEHRVNLIRLAHLQAVRLRNAARSRYRRLQTIRMYTPSSVREMFAFQSTSGENSPGSGSPLQGGAEGGGRRSFAAYRPLVTPRAGTGEDARGSDEPGHFHTVLNNVAVPLMNVNDLPAAGSSAEPPSQPPPPPPPPSRLPRIHEYLQPIILAQNAMVVDEDGNPGEGGSGGGGGGGGGGGLGGARRISAGMAGLLDAGLISEAMPAPSHRVQAWDFSKGDPPEIANSTKNVVVQKCRIHNDASIDISKDGRLLVALLPVARLRNTNHWLGVYSLEWSRLGQCLHTAVLEQSAVSVALSPTARHLAVGLGSRRFTSAPHARNNVFALLYRLDPLESSSRTGLSPIKELEQNWEQGFTSLNCLRWAPQPGQGLVYANNTGQLIIMS